MYRLALERRGTYGPFLAVAEDGVPFRELGEAIGRRLDIPTGSIAPEDATKHFGALAMPVAGNGPVSNLRTRELLGWKPLELGLIPDIDQNYS